MQEAFALTPQEAASAPEGYVMKLKAAGKQYNVYVHSYLGYGLMAGRAKLIEEAAKAAAGAGAAAGHPCFPAGYTGSYKYAGKDYAVAAAPKAEFGSCAKVGLSALQLEMECGAEKVSGYEVKGRGGEGKWDGGRGADWDVWGDWNRRVEGGWNGRGEGCGEVIEARGEG